MRDDYGLNALMAHPAFAGLIGALVSLKFAPGTRWVERIFNVFCGVAIAWNLSMPIAVYFKLDVAQFSGAIGFMLGLAGMHVAHALLTATLGILVREVEKMHAQHEQMKKLGANKDRRNHGDHCK